MCCRQNDGIASAELYGNEKLHSAGPPPPPCRDEDSSARRTSGDLRSHFLGTCSGSSPPSPAPFSRAEQQRVSTGGAHVYGNKTAAISGLSLVTRTGVGFRRKRYPDVALLGHGSFLDGLFVTKWGAVAVIAKNSAFPVIFEMPSSNLALTLANGNISRTYGPASSSCERLCLS